VNLPPCPRSGTAAALITECYLTGMRDTSLFPASDDQIAEQVGDGLWLENLHYLNLSDRRTACTTGLTRFAAFRVIDGERKAPIGVMRFDDSVLRLLGEGLLGLTRRRERLPRTMTYGGRHTGGMEIPGAIVDGFRLTL